MVPVAPMTMIFMVSPFAVPAPSAARGGLMEVKSGTARRISQAANAPKRTLRQIVLERLEEAGPKGSKAAAIRGYAKDNLQRDFSIKAVGMTLNRLAKEGRARRAGQVWFPVQQRLQTEDDGAITF
jgi:hypothetical protein